MTEAEKKEADQGLEVAIINHFKKIEQEKALKECHHEIDPATETYDPRYGRRGICKHCGKEIYFMRFARTKTGKVKMSKKERLRRRRELKAALDKTICPKCKHVGMVPDGAMLRCPECNSVFKVKRGEGE